MNTEEEEGEDSTFDKEALNKEFPNKTSINKLKEVDLVVLAKRIGLNITTEDKVSESRKTVIDFFKKNIW